METKPRKIGLYVAVSVLVSVMIIAGLFMFGVQCLTIVPSSFKVQTGTLVVLLMSMFDLFVSKPEITAAILWATFAASWYVTSAKRYVPLTPREVQILWKVHKQEAQCGAKRWRKIMRKNKIIGFECRCGYRHLQKRPII